MKRRTFIRGSIAAAVSAALPSSPSVRLPPISVGPMIAKIGPGRMLRDFEAAEVLGARVRASMFISGKLLDPLQMTDRIRSNLAGIDRVCSVVRSECVDGGLKITVSEDQKS